MVFRVILYFSKYALRKPANRLIYQVRLIVNFLAIKLGTVGAKDLGQAASGNGLLQLRKNYSLGKKGFILEIPKDEVIYRQVKHYGNWELEESEFLSDGLVISNVIIDTKVALLDIGANTGLVTLQALNLSKVCVDVFLFEPIHRNVNALKFNLRELKNIKIIEASLSDRDGESNFFTEITNQIN